MTPSAFIFIPFKLCFYYSILSAIGQVKVGLDLWSNTVPVWADIICFTPVTMPKKLWKQKDERKGRGRAIETNNALTRAQICVSSTLLMSISPIDEGLKNNIELAFHLKD